MNALSPLRVPQGEESSADEDDIDGLALEGDLDDEEEVPGTERTKNNKFTRRRLEEMSSTPRKNCWVCPRV